MKRFKKWIKGGYEIFIKIFNLPDKEESREEYLKRTRNNRLDSHLINGYLDGTLSENEMKTTEYYLSVSELARIRLAAFKKVREINLERRV
ncbi:hypothetical protein HYW74_02090 [Candidatus Pacearchaeota archaeon]|nr:hypothetical protein [Candidatus Pacearchaeota archaeon]